MTPTANESASPPPIHPRTRTMESWRARKAVMASRGEVDGPRVAECDSALSWWRTRSFLIREMSLTEERADDLLELARSAPTADTEAVTQ